MSIHVLYSQTDAAEAANLLAQLRAAGEEVTEAVPTGRDGLTVAVVSPAALNDRAFQDVLYRALDAGQHVVLAQTAPVTVPKMLNHLRLVSLTDGASAVQTALADLRAPGIKPPMRTVTPRVQASNRSSGLILLLLVLTVFVVGTWAIIAFDIESPQAEYDEVDTEAAGTINALILPTMEYLGTFVPRSTEQSVEFPATLEGVGTRVRPFLAQTATANATALQGIFGSPEPEATETPEG